MIKKISDGEVEITMEVSSDYEDHRLKTFFDKEPETISWINELFKPLDTFFDIGANVGVFSLYAAAYFKDKGGINIFSFEPAYHNFETLSKNIIINGLNDSITPYPVAIGDRTEFTAINLASTISGSASHAVDGSPDFIMKDFKSEFRQGVFSVKLDDLTSKFNFKAPSHIKLDVDGFEEKIINGGKETLKNPDLKSILIEITDYDGSKKRIVDILIASGFNNNHPLNFQDNHSKKRREKAGNSRIENLIFTR